MTFSTIDIGTTANDGTGDELRNAFIKVNDNFLLVTEQVSIPYLTATLSSYETIIDADVTHNDLYESIAYVRGIADQNTIDLQANDAEISSFYTLLDGKASLTQLNNAIASLNLTIANLQLDVDTKIPEAPKDGFNYARRNGAWIKI